MARKTYRHATSAIETLRARIPVDRVTGKGRPRGTAVGGHVRMYTPKSTQRMEAVITAEWLAQCGSRASFTGPVEVSIGAHKALGTSATWSRDGEPDTYVPDVDNITKLVLDALNGAAFADDCQVVSLTVTKVPRRKGLESFYEVQVTYLEVIKEER